jgi:hypothetical protein
MICVSCRSVYKSLQPVETDSRTCLQKIQPAFKRALYTAQVDVTKNHLSGLLLIKQMPDSSTRLVFTMESGFKFFDFEFAKDGTFTVHHILDKMNKKAVITTLRKDFEMMLMQMNAAGKIEGFRKDSLIYHRVTRADEFDYYITDASCNKMIRAEKTGGKKTKVIMTMQDWKDDTPGSIDISHQNFTFHILLHKLEQ